jgi:hypothetical protein
MIQVCYYKGCGVIYGEKEPLAEKTVTHGLCPEHLRVFRREIEAEMSLMNLTDIDPTGEPPRR